MVPADRGCAGDGGVGEISQMTRRWLASQRVYTRSNRARHGTCNHGTWGIEVERSEVQGQPWLHSKFQASLGYI